VRTLLQVLSEDERAQVHERTLRILTKTGMRVDTAFLPTHQALPLGEDVERELDRIQKRAQEIAED